MKKNKQDICYLVSISRPPGHSDRHQADNITKVSSSPIPIIRMITTRLIALKGLSHEINIILKVHNNKQVLSVHFFLIWWKNQTQSFSLLIFKILPVTRFKVPKAAILTLNLITGSCLWFCKIIPEATCNKLILADFQSSQWEVGTREYRPITEKGILRRASVSCYKNFKSFPRSK